MPLVTADHRGPPKSNILTKIMSTLPPDHLQEFIPSTWLGRWERLPGYLRRVFLMRARSRFEDQVARPARIKARKEAERARIKALRQPPAKVWRDGNYIRWEPPTTFRQLKPEGFWLWSQMDNGEWTQHHPLIRPERRKVPFPSQRAAKIVTKYPQEALGECYPSEEIPAKK